MERLLPVIEGGVFSRYLAIRLTHSPDDYIKNNKNVRIFINFNGDNPTGHYKLDLGCSMGFAVAGNLLLLDSWENMINAQLKRKDSSQNSNRSLFRNVRFQDGPLPVNSVAEWNMPECDTFECDYVSSVRPLLSHIDDVVDRTTLSSILLTLQHSGSPGRDQLDCLRRVSHMIFITAMQLRQLLGVYKDAGFRADLFICFFMRVVDMHNEKLFRIRFEDPKELHAIQRRLGFVTYFPCIQPENAEFELDFTIKDERLAMHTILTLWSKEGMRKQTQNIVDFSYIHANGRKDPLPSGVPRSWATLKSIPSEGVFRCRYVCAPEDRSFTFRRALLETLGYWEMPVMDESDVMWRMGLHEAPEDALGFVEFLLSHGKDVCTVYREIDGFGGNGVITLRELEDGYKKMVGKKPSSSLNDWQKRSVKAVFRFLDKSGEGEVSFIEWCVLLNLYDEIKSCISEFVQYCELMYGPDLKDIWDNLDADGSGEIDQEEWDDAVQGIGFFGPSRPIFNFLDKDHGGSISLEELEELSAFLSKPCVA